MPIKHKNDLEWGQKMFLKDDDEQLQHSLIGIILEPSGVVKFRLSYCGDVCEVYDFEATTERDEKRVLGMNEPE